MEESLRPDIADDLGFIMKSMGEHHPNEPHWYLPLIAADPHWVGQGLGALLMKHSLRRCDEEGIPAYLESSNPRNISLYERLGFNIIGKIQSGSSPVLTPMLRPPFGFDREFASRVERCEPTCSRALKPKQSRPTGLSSKIEALAEPNGDRLFAASQGSAIQAPRAQPPGLSRGVF